MMRKFLPLVLLLPLCGAGQVSCVSPGMLFCDTNCTTWIRLPGNSDASDFSVSSYGKGFVFTSSRNSDFAVQHHSADPQAPLLDLYYFEKKDSLSFTHPHPLSPLNSKYNDGPACFSSDGNEVICTRSNAATGTLQLFCSRQHNGKWSEPELLSFCKTGNNYVHPAFAGDSLLFFASDQPGGSGKMDLWYAKRNGEGWAAPVNAGNKINSSANDEFPFCSAFGNLYFSSDRPGSQSLDVYVLHLRDSLWCAPAKLGEPLNSTADDFGFWCSKEEDEGFISSNREKANDDLYYFRLKWPSATAADTLKKAELCYTFFETASMTTWDTVALAYEWSFSDGEKARGLEVKKCFDTLGVYHVDLNIVDASSGEIFTTEVSYELDISQPNFIDMILPDSVNAGEPLKVDALHCTAAEGWTVTPVCVDFNDGYRSGGGTASHVYRRAGNYSPSVLFLVKNNAAGTVEYRRVIKTLQVTQPL